MALETYKTKRSFNKTSEPTGGKPTSNSLLFVVQKHAASHLHYDFRLEMKGILKSWAVPKGPSMNAQDRRLAMLVEDHPYDYRNFEGTIPEGNYGAGTVIVWDQGTYDPLESVKTKKEKEHILLRDFYSGSLKIKLKGQKLKGEFELYRTPDKGETSWMLVKVDDDYANDKDVSEEKASVLTGKTLQDYGAAIEGDPDDVPAIGPKDKDDYRNIIEEAKNAEEKNEMPLAEKLYKQQIKKGHDVEFAYNRLMIIYRKQKRYKEELELINQGIKHLEDFYNKKAQESIGGKSKVKQLSSSLMKSLGMTDKKGRSIYEPEPLPKWRKRKQIVEKKVKG